VGVLLRHPAAYERTIRDVFGSAGIPYVLLDGTPFADTLSGRLLHLLVRIRMGGYPRAEVMEFLGLAPLRSQIMKADPHASPADWDRYSREAGIVRGHEHWRRVRDMRRRVEWRIKRRREESRDEADPSHVALLERDLRSLQVFERAVSTLLKRLEAIPQHGTVATLMLGLLRALLAVARPPEEDRPVLGEMATLARETVADEEVSFETFASMFDELFEQRLPPSDVYRSGRVTVGSLNGVAGLPFKLALVPGLAERSFPPPLAQDPVVLDREREALNADYGVALATREQHAADELFAFRQTTAAARESLVLSYPRLDAATGHVRVPSHYLLRIAEALTGEPADYKSLADLTRRVPLARLDPERGVLTPVEWDLALVARAVASGGAEGLSGLPGFAAMARGTAAEANRWGQPRFTQFDGLLGGRLAPPATMSATHLETYGRCPFKFFGERVLGVRELDEPEEVDTITPLDRGSIIHDILQEFLAALVADGLVPLDRASAEDYRRRLQEIARDVFAKFEASGAVGYPFMWRVERERIMTDLEGFLAEELADEAGYVPAYFEARFGPASWGPMTRGSSPEPLELKAGEHALRFTGFIDRIDVHRSGKAARVIDYKTGRVGDAKENLLRGGESLQLPLYILAADALLARGGVEAATREALYYFVTGRGGFRRVHFSRDALNARDVEFRATLETMAAGIAGGVFPQRPGKGGHNCQWCAFQPVCGHGRVRLVERKAGDPAIARLAAMWEIE
jgi:ATP-dependent helicase/DNAse subunit B